MAEYKDVSSLEVVAYKGGNEDFDNGVQFILEKLDAIPTADVSIVKHGKWIEHHIQSYLVHPMKYDEYDCPVLRDCVYYECSECGRTESKKEPYCHCGAKMDEVV